MSILAMCILVALLKACSPAQLSKLSKLSKLSTKIKSEKLYRSQEGRQVYGVGVDRVSSSAELEGNKCQGVPRGVSSKSDLELFRMGHSENKNRAEKIYQKLTSLDDHQNVIQEFEVVGQYLFLVTTLGEAYFVKQADPKLVEQVATTIPEDTLLNSKVIVLDHLERALILTPSQVVLCRPGRATCDQIPGFVATDHIESAKLYAHKGATYLLVLTGPTMATYLLTPDGRLQSKAILDSIYFGSQSITLKSVLKIDGDKLLLLDETAGVRQVSFSGDLTNFNSHLLLYEQFGCFQMIGRGDAVVLGCTPSAKSNFILKLEKVGVNYEPAETIFLQEKLYAVEMVDDLLIGKVYSGVNFYWSSVHPEQPYPYSYRAAGDILLHNARQSKAKVVNDTTLIYLATEDEIVRYELRETKPVVFCYSLKAVSEQYSLNYSYSCSAEQAARTSKKVCYFQEDLLFQAWEHKEVKFSTMLIPFMLSLFGLLCVLLALYKLRHRYTKDVETAKLKYNVDDDFDFET